MSELNMELREKKLAIIKGDNLKNKYIKVKKLASIYSIILLYIFFYFEKYMKRF